MAVKNPWGIAHDALDSALGPAREWLEGELNLLIAGSYDAPRFAAAFTSATRRVGKGQLGAAIATVVSPETRASLEVVTLDELVRMFLLVGAVLNASDADAIARVKRAYDDGENRERRAVLRALPFLAPKPELHLALAIDACRSSVTTIFEAIALDNTYPAQYFPEPNFNQMALKTAFVELPIARILRLNERKNRDLDRMARDYQAEREAAHRAVPADLGLLMITGTES